MTIRVSLLSVLLLAASVIAQEAIEEQRQPELRRYTVEIIVFAYAQNVSTGSEVFVPDRPPAGELLPADVGIEEISLQIRDSRIDEFLAQLENDAENERFELVMLADEDFTLLEAYEHLRRLDAYEPLLHFGWTQPTLPDRDVQSRPLSSFIAPPDGLQGDLRLYLSRYLHLAIDLQMDAPVMQQTAAAAFAGSLGRRSFYFDDDVDPVRYRIVEDRIFRNGELRYFDHPKFGVLAKVTRVEEPEPEAQDDEIFNNLELLGD